MDWLGDYPYRIDIGAGLYIFADRPATSKPEKDKKRGQRK
jgi:hypothetical protein